MSDSAGGILLQICPNDHPPFKDICCYYAAAAKMLGWQVVTIFFAPPRDAAMQDAHYLNAADVRRTAPVARALQSEVAAALAGTRPSLALCHRYRAYRILLASDLPVERVVTVAHEFGFFSRSQRRLAVRVRRLNRARKVVFAGVSDAVRRELLEVDPSAVLLPNGIDLARADAIRMTRADARDLLGLGADEFCIAVVGRLHPKKAPALALEGFRLAAPAMPRARLIFMGTGELAASLQRSARGLPVTFAGFVPDAARYFAGLDLLLLPSSRKEAFGMVALEAMAAGLPVLSSAAPGPRFVLGDTASYFEPATSATLAFALGRTYEMWRSGTLAAGAGAARERAAARFSLPAAAERLRQLICS